MSPVSGSYTGESCESITWRAFSSLVREYWEVAALFLCFLGVALSGERWFEDLSIQSREKRGKGGKVRGARLADYF